MFAVARQLQDRRIHKRQPKELSVTCWNGVKNQNIAVFDASLLQPRPCSTHASSSISVRRELSWDFENHPDPSFRLGQTSFSCRCITDFTNKFRTIITLSTSIFG